MSTARTVAGPIQARIVQKLTDSLKPTRLVVKDQSHLHAKHEQSPKLPETHFDVLIVSDSFTGLKLRERHRKVYDILADEITERVHALSMKTRTSVEDISKPTS